MIPVWVLRLCLGVVVVRGKLFPAAVLLRPRGGIRVGSRMERRLYTAAVLALTPVGEATQRALSPETSLHSFFRQLAGRLAARA